MNRGSLRAAAAAGLVLLAAAVLSFRPVYEPDLGWHLAQGRETLSSGFVRSNIFSFTYPDYRQHFTAWLFDTGAYLAWRLGGDVAVQSLQAALLAAAFAILYLAMRTRAAAMPTIAILIVGFFVIEPRALPRPYLVSLAGIAACVWLIERAIARRSSSPLLWAVPLIALWSNAHAESILGVLLVGLFGISEWLRPAALDRREAVRTLAIAISCALAILANPYGWGPVLYMYENLSVPQLLNIAELQPAHLPAYRAFFVYLGVACVLLLSAPRRLTLWEASAALVTAALGLRFVRLTPLVFLVTAPMIAARLSAWTTRVDGRAMIVTACAAAVVISRVPLSALVTEVRAGGLHPETFFSTGAVAFASAQGLRGPLFNSNNLGGWLAWTLYPDARTFQDSRLQTYPPEHHRRIVEASQSQAAWDALVSGVDWAMLSTPRPNQLSGAGRFPSTNWATVYWDEAVEILVRRESRYAALAASHEYLVMTPRAQIFDLAPRLASPEGARIRAEARRLRSENPTGFTPAAILCLAGDARACGDADRLAAEQGFLEDEVGLMRALRGR